MRKKSGKKEEGAPAWMLTYGDLVTQVLCFFVLLFSMSSIDIAKFKEIFYPEAEIIEPSGAPEASVTITMKKLKEGERKIELVKGIEIPVLRIPDGLKITLEGDTFFKEGSAKLDENVIIEKMEGKLLTRTMTVREYFDAIATYIQQTYHKLEIRGHTDIKKEDSIIIKKDKDEIYDWWLLSFYRSHETMNLLRRRSEELFQQLSLTPEKRFEIVAYGRTQPIFSDTIDRPEQSKYNRRVEIIIRFDSYK